MITPDEIRGIIEKLALVAIELEGALRRDPDGVIRVDQDERRRVGRLIVRLGRTVVRDLID